MKKLLCMGAAAAFAVGLSLSAFALDPAWVPDAPQAGALISHDFEGGEFDSLTAANNNTDEKGNKFQYKSGTKYYSVVEAPAGAGKTGSVLKLDGDAGGGAYLNIALAAPVTGKLVIRMDFMVDAVSTGRKEILKLFKDAAVTNADFNRVIDFQTASAIVSNGASYAPCPTYVADKWYHADVIFNFAAADGDNNVIVQLTDPDGTTHRQDYAHGAAISEVGAVRFATIANNGSLYLDNLEIYTPAPYEASIGANTLSVAGGTLLGEVTLSVTKSGEASQDATAVLAVADSAGRLVYVKAADKPLAQGANSITFSGVNASGLTGAGYRARVMVWDGTDTLRPLCGAAEAPVSENES